MDFDGKSLDGLEEFGACRKNDQREEFFKEANLINDDAKEVSNESDARIAKKRRCFLVETKLKAIDFFERTKDKSHAARKVGVARQVVQQWCKQKDDLEKQAATKGKTMKRIGGGGRNLKDLDFDKKDSLVDYIIYMEKMRKEGNYVSIFACDETGIFLDASNSLTIANKGSNEVSVLSTGHDKMRISVMLTARDDGFKCKPFILLNRVRPNPKVVTKFHNKLEGHWGGSTWMNDASIGIYLQKVLGAPLLGKRLLVWDAFSAHRSETTKKKLKELQIDSILAPGGCNKFIQASDVVWNI